MPSFSSSLLDAIYHSIDEPLSEYTVHRRKNDAVQVEEEVESLRRAIMIEKWMENHSSMSTPRHVPSNSGSSTDSSIFSSSETDSSSASRSTPRDLISSSHKQKPVQIKPKHEGRFTKTKSRAMKIYGDLKKVREPISPGGKIATFFNSIFSPRNNPKRNNGVEDWNAIGKSRSMKGISSDNAASSCPLASRSCLSKNPSSKCNKSKRSVRFCPVNVVLDEGCKSISHDEYLVTSSSMPCVGSQFIKKNIDSFQVYEAKSVRRNEFIREFYEHERDMDVESYASSDLFELENIGLRVHDDDDELPVYETTSLVMNKAICYS